MTPAKLAEQLAKAIGDARHFLGSVYENPGDAVIVRLADERDAMAAENARLKAEALDRQEAFLSINERANLLSTRNAELADQNARLVASTAPPAWLPLGQHPGGVGDQGRGRWRLTSRPNQQPRPAPRARRRRRDDPSEA